MTVLLTTAGGSTLCATTASTEVYCNETYRLERREIATHTNARGYRTIWCWEVLSGPAVGIYGGKCATKAEARKWARHTVREVGPEIESGRTP